MVAVADPHAVDVIDAVAVLLGEPVEPVVASATKIIDHINKIYSRLRGGAELEESDKKRTTTRRPSSAVRGARRHPRRQRRGADHPLGQLAACSRPSRSARPISTSSPARRTSSSATASTACCAKPSARRKKFHAVDHRAREDHGRPQHRREAAAAGRPHPPQDRRQGHRHARRDRADRRPASASRSVCSIAARCCSTSPTSASPTITSSRSATSSSARTASCWSPGPTGSGKTTTLYACLSEINAPDINILTVEDPVEYQLEGISQTAGQLEDRADVRVRAALVPAPRSRRHHGRRDPRPRDRRDRDHRVAHRPPGVLDRPHQRRRRRHHAPGRHGHRAVPRRVVAGRPARPAPGAPAVLRVRARRCGRREEILRRARPRSRDVLRRRLPVPGGQGHAPAAARHGVRAGRLPGVQRSSATTAGPASTSC